MRFLRAIGVPLASDDPDFDPRTQGTLQTVPFRANITTGTPVRGFNEDEERPQDGATWRLETNGDYNGTIAIKNLTASRYLSLPTSSKDWGINIGGTMNGAINVTDSVLVANIRAANFTQPITVGYLLKGGVIATNGSIPSIEAGYNDLVVTTPGRQRGFVGSICGPSTDPDNPVTSVCDSLFSETDSVIRASQSIGTVRIFSSNLGRGKSYRPRIEAPVIGRIEGGRLDTLVV